jgi:hypothetical protein
MLDKIRLEFIYATPDIWGILDLAKFSCGYDFSS